MEAITHLIKNGLLKDLHIAEKSFRLNKKISESQNEIVNPVKKDISKILYDLTYTEMILSLCRLYDKPDKSYPTICLKQLYKKLKESDYKLELKESKENILSQLIDSEWAYDLKEVLIRSTDSSFNKYASDFIETIELNHPISGAILNIKEIRDKFLAHNEDIKIDTTIPYESITILIAHAKDVLSFFSLAYSGIHLRTATGSFYLSQSTFDWEIKYRKFLKEISG